MKAQKGLSTHSTVRGGPGYFPTGYSTGGANVNVISNEMDHPGWEGSKVAHFTNTHHKVKKSPYVDIFDQDVRPAPGYYKSTSWDGFEHGNIPNINSPLVNENGHIYQFPQDFLHATGVADLQHDAANAPHQWLRPVVEEDHSEEMLQEYFANISSQVLRDKVEILREEGYDEDEIMRVIEKTRERDIERKFNKPESVIRRSAHAFGDSSTPYYIGPSGNRYPDPVEKSFMRAHGSSFGPYQSHGHLPGDERPRAVSEGRPSSHAYSGSIHTFPPEHHRPRAQDTGTVPESTFGRLPAPRRPFVPLPRGQRSMHEYGI